MDIQLFYFFNNLAGRWGVFDMVVVFFAHYVPYLLMVVFLGFLYFSKYSLQKKIHIFWVTMLSAAIARGFITELIRMFYHRPRPFVALPVHQLLVDSAWSFPSGHATFFFAMAAALYFHNKKWGAWFFVASVLISIARVIAGVHYPSDIVGGALIGVAVAYTVTHYLSKDAYDARK
jgi:undecaprenyl-diphosphatase